MSATESEIKSFLKDSGWADASCHVLTSGFSPRTFARLTQKETKKTAILMRSDKDQRTEAFVHLSNLLRRIGLATPEIYYSDIVRDLVLMEDFGDNNVGCLIGDGNDRNVFDDQAVKILSVLHKDFRQDMLGAFKTSLYNAALFSDQVTLFLDYYYPKIFHRLPTARERSGFVSAWHDVLSPLDNLPRSLLLRDFMPDNMMSLSSPVLNQNVGLVDFQDAGIGPIAYDLASWCEDVRRDGGIESLPSFVEKYHKLNPTVELDELLNATKIYSAQRHARILGILVKLNKTEYIPRVWKVLQELLKEKSLEPVRNWFLSCPPPSSSDSS